MGCTVAQTTKGATGIICGHKQCRCNCGFTCGRECGLEIMECIRLHYKRDCDHQWDGPEEEQHHPGGAVSSSVTCSKCGMSAMVHDMRVGP